MFVAFTQAPDDHGDYFKFRILTKDRDSYFTSYYDIVVRNYLSVQVSPEVDYVTNCYRIEKTFLFQPE